MQMIITISIVIAAAVGLIVRLFKRNKKRGADCNSPSSLCDSCNSDCCLRNLKDSKKR